MYVQKEIAIIHWYLLPLFIGLKEKLWTIHHSVQSLSFDKGWFYREQFDYIHIHHNNFIFISVLVMGMKTQYICLTKSEFICYDNEYDMNYRTCTDDVYTLIDFSSTCFHITWLASDVILFFSMYKGPLYSLVYKH